MKALRLISNGVLLVRSKTTREERDRNSLKTILRYKYKIHRGLLIIYIRIRFHKLQLSSKVSFCSTFESIERAFLFDMRR